MTDLALHLISETATTVTLGWTPPVGCRGFVFVANGKRSSTLDPTRSTVKFSKPGPYSVEALGTLAQGTYPPTTPPPPAGTVIYKADYNTPQPYGFTWGIQAGNHGYTDPAHAGTVFETAADPSGTTRKVAHCKLPAATGGRAAEGLIKRTVDVGVTDFYGFSLMVPQGWHSLHQNTGWHTLSGQFNYSNVGDGGPPVALVVGTSSLEMMVLSGIVSVDGNGVANGYEYQASPNVTNRLPIGPLPEATWIDLVIEVKWATDWTGHLNVWTRTGSNPYAQVVSKQGIPTQQHLAGQAPPTVTCDKHGLYAGPGSDPFEVWLTGLVRGTSFQAVTA